MTEGKSRGKENVQESSGSCDSEDASTMAHTMETTKVNNIRDSHPVANLIREAVEIEQKNDRQV